MNRKFKQSWIPWVLYPLGDLIAQLIIGEIQIARLFALAVIGGLVYQYEVPLWFGWLNQFSFSESVLKNFPMLQAVTTPEHGLYPFNWIGRTLGAMAYFSPIWITRHLLILKLATTPWEQIAWFSTLKVLWVVSCKSFLVNFPFSLLGNYMIQSRLPLKARFLGSIIMTGLFSIAYALAYKFF